MAMAAVLEVARETEGLRVGKAFGLLRDGTPPAYGAMLASNDALESPRPRRTGH